MKQNILSTQQTRYHNKTREEILLLRIEGEGWRCQSKTKGESRIIFSGDLVEKFSVRASAGQSSVEETD